MNLTSLLNAMPGATAGESRPEPLSSSGSHAGGGFSA